MNITQANKKFTEINNIFSKRNNLYIFLETKTQAINGKSNSQKRSINVKII